jgi:hypothetical protein
LSGAPTGDDGTAVVEAVRTSVDRLVGDDPEFMQGMVDALGTLVGDPAGDGVAVPSLRPAGRGWVRAPP